MDNIDHRIQCFESELKSIKEEIVEMVQKLDVVYSIEEKIDHVEFEFDSIKQDMMSAIEDIADIQINFDSVEFDIVSIKEDFDDVKEIVETPELA